METHLSLVGGLLVVLALLHAGFPRYFNWRRELSGLSLLSRQMMHIHTLFIALTVLGMGLLCLGSPAELAGTRLGGQLSLGMSVFWAVRLFVQFFGYSPALWRGKPFETLVHVVFSLLWLYVSGVFAWVYLANPAR